MKRKLAGAAITMLLAGVAAGCGGDDGDGTTNGGSPLPLAKPEFIARADKICGDTKEQIQVAATRLREAGAKSGTLAVPLVTQFLEQTSLPAYEAMLGKVRGLAPPVDDEKTIDGYVAALANAIDTVKTDPETYAKNSAPNDPFDAPKARARAYGMKVCGS